MMNPEPRLRPFDQWRKCSRLAKVKRSKLHVRLHPGEPRCLNPRIECSRPADCSDNAVTRGRKMPREVTTDKAGYTGDDDVHATSQLISTGGLVSGRFSASAGSCGMVAQLASSDSP